jgi:hypothetical protein
VGVQCRGTSPFQRGASRRRLGDRWYLGGDARGIGGKVDRYDVSIFQADVFARYFFSDRWGAGAGWYFNDVTVDSLPK